MAWILSGIARALSSGALDAWFVDSLQAVDPDIDIQAPLAKAGTVSLLALGAGTLLGGALPALFSGLPAEGQAVITPFTTTLLLSGVLNLALLLAVTLLVKEKRPQDSAGSWSAGIGQVPAIVRDAVGLTRRNGILQMLLALTLVGGLALASVETFWQPRFAGILGGAEDRTYLFGAIMAGSFLIGAGGNILSILSAAG